MAQAKRLEARVKADSVITAVTAFGGRHYNRTQWFAVPAGAEGEAKDHDMLETRPIALSEPASDEGAPREIKASKAVVKYATEVGIDLADVTGSGKRGAIIKADVMGAMIAQQAAESAEGDEPAPPGESESDEPAGDEESSE